LQPKKEYYGEEKHEEKHEEYKPKKEYYKEEKHEEYEVRLDSYCYPQPASPSPACWVWPRLRKSNGAQWYQQQPRT
jgi:hypothetical protein